MTRVLSLYYNKSQHTISLDWIQLWIIPWKRLYQHISLHNTCNDYNNQYMVYVPVKLEEAEFWEDVSLSSLHLQPTSS